MALANVQSTPQRFTNTAIKSNLLPIPVVNNVISNEDISLMQVQNKSKDKLVLPQIREEGLLLMKALKILTDKHYDGLVQRHYKTIKKIPKQYDNGISLKELILLLELIERCHHLIHVDIKYEDCVITLLQPLSKPFLKEKMSDETTFLDKTAIFWTKVGLIVEASSVRVKLSLSRCLYKLVNYDCSNMTSMTYSSAVRKSFINSTIEKSRICKSLAECYQSVPLEEEKMVMLQCLAKLSGNRLQASDMIQGDMISNILADVKLCHHDYGMVFMSIEILWNLLEYGPKDLLQKKFQNLESLIALHELFLYQSKNCTSVSQRQIRNDILLLFTQIASLCPNAPFVECGIAKTTALYAGINISSTGEICKKTVAQPYEDFELKKIIFSLVISLCRNQSSVQVFSSQGLVLSLFSYVQVIDEPVNIMWTLAGFEELQLYALAVLATLAPLCISDYIECQGNTRLLVMLDWCINTDDFVGHGNGFHGIGGRGSKRAQMRHCLRLLHSVCSLDNENIFQDLADQGAISQLVAILSSCSNSNDPNDEIDFELQCDMMFVLATLCQSNIQRKVLFGDTGVQVVIQYLNGYLNEKNGPLHNHKLVLSAVDLFWSAVYGCYSNEMCFLAKEGGYLLMDLLEICGDSLQNFVLGALLDLMENKNTLSCFESWRSDTGKSFSQLLLQMWQNEEAKLGVLRDQSGVLIDITKPLLTLEQASEELIPLSTFLPTPSIIDVADNIRAKIYGVFLHLGFKNSSELSANDYVTFAIVERYLDFKTMEVWEEIDKELQIEGIEPVENDKEIMEKIQLIFHKKAENVSELQKALIENNKDMEILKEQRFYEKIREKHWQEEKRFDEIMNYIARTSNVNTLKNERKKQLTSIEQSRTRTIALEKEAILHDMVEKRLLTTVFCGRNVTLKSTVYPSDVAKFDEIE